MYEVLKSIINFFMYFSFNFLVDTNGIGWVTT